MIRKLLTQSIVWYALMAGILFVAAGTLAWPGAWAFLVEMIVLGLGSAFWLLHHDLELLEERLKSPIQQAQTAADRWIISVFLVLWFAWLVVMGLEVRWRGASRSPWMEAAGGLLIAAAIGIVCWAASANSYASPVVRIQTERHHRVATTGPYRFVRHPMYSGSLLLFLGIPLLLGSRWGLVWVPILGGLFALRSILEERVLLADLDGYAEYAAHVRSRLIPTIW
jgi:protein-S-isoprenylcysteine O-methyltransferase Ste14